MRASRLQYWEAANIFYLSVTVVHPPEIKAIVKARVMTDKKAARILARLLAAGLLPPVWVPPREVRDLRAIIAQRHKMVNLSTQAKNRLQSLLHRYQIIPPPNRDLYADETRDWWESLPLSAIEQFRIQSDLETLLFAREQVQRFEAYLARQAVADERVPLLVQLPDIGLINAMTILAAVGDISRFPTPGHLVGYAGIGASVHESGQTRRTGKITKTGRRDLRHAMIEAAHIAKRKHPHWKAKYRQLERRAGKQKALVAIARKLLVPCGTR